MHRAAYRVETVVRDLLADLVRRQGWASAALAYPGHGGGGRVRVLGRYCWRRPARTRAPDGTCPGGGAC